MCSTLLLTLNWTPGHGIYYMLHTCDGPIAKWMGVGGKMNWRIRLTSAKVWVEVEAELGNMQHKYDMTWKDVDKNLTISRAFYLLWKIYKKWNSVSNQIQLHLWCIFPLSLLILGFLINDYSQVRGFLMTPKLFSAIFTFIWTCGTIIDQFIVKGVHPWSCRNFFFRVPQKLLEL